MEACPTSAIYKREDGIVLIEDAKCIGCNYCAWACPYGAMQYDRTTGRMTKCTFCVDLIDVGLSPVCVTACPLRVLEFGDRIEMETKYRPTQVIYPMPETELTEPALVVTPHKDAVWTVSEPAQIDNREEV
jgi:anaerobic dimethyl sulfoxide reductase subunit B (iron-sulfur subunit)